VVWSLLQVLARPLIVGGWVIRVQVSWDVLRADRAEHGRALGLGCCGDPVGLAGGRLGEQPDGEPGVAGGVACFGVSEDGGGLGRGVGGEGEPCGVPELCR